MYFNNEKDATNFIIDYVLPFINADYEVDKKINKIIKTNSKAIKEIIFSSNDNNKLEKTLQKNKEEIAELVKLKDSEIKTSFINLRNKCIDLHNTKIIDDRFVMGYQQIDSIPNDLINYLNWLLKTPFKMNNSNNKNAKEYEKELEDYLNYNNKIRYLKWKGIARCRTYLTENYCYSYEKIIKKVCSFAVTECLWTVFDYNEFVFDDDRSPTIQPYQIDKLFNEKESIEEINEIFFKEEDEYNGCELLCNDVIKSFKERDENDISNFILKGEGFKYIDLCPICDRLFHKNRKDKEYCSLECSKVGSMRKIRAKK